MKMHAPIISKLFIREGEGGGIQSHGIHQTRDLVSSLEAYVTQGGLGSRVLGVYAKGEDCVECPDPMYLTR